MKKYYVYALLDTSKPGIYVYDDLVFDYEPFYIGKGTDNRHYHSSFDRHNSFKKNKIKSLNKKNIKVLSIKVFEDLNEQESFNIETTIESILNEQNKFQLNNTNNIDELKQDLNNLKLMIDSGLDKLNKNLFNYEFKSIIKSFRYSKLVEI